MEKRGDAGIGHKRDVKHNSKIGKHFIKYIFRKETNKGIEKKQGDISKPMVFLMVQEGWKKHKTGDAKGDKNAKEIHL